MRWLDYLAERPWVVVLAVCGAGLVGAACVVGLIWLGMAKP